jgi:osmotically-inducible protein OsmY
VSHGFETIRFETIPGGIMKTHAVLLSIVLLCGCAKENGTTHAADASKSSTSQHSTTTTTPSPTPSPTPGHTTDTTTHTTDSTSSHPSDTTKTAGTTAKSETEADRHLVEQVRKALAESPSAAPAQTDVQVSAQSGTITLRGEVANTEVKTTIEDLVKSVPGVQKVNDELTVKAG